MSSRSWGGLSLSRHSGVQAIFGARVTKRRRTSSSSATASAASKDARALVKDEVRDDVYKSPLPDISDCDVKSEYDGHDEWVDLCIPPEELRASASLITGQCFNWRQASSDCWVGVLGRGVVAIRQTERGTLFRRISSADVTENVGGHSKRESKTKPGARGGFKHESETKPQVGGSGSARAETAALEAKLRDYFALREPLAPLYQRWSEGDARMAAVAASIPGVRVVRQDPVECIFSFICSSNNNIPRITSMLGNLRRTYGELLLSVGEGGLAATGVFGTNTEVEDWAKMPLELHSFPTVNALADNATEGHLRAMGFGYRAKYIVQSAKLMQMRGGADWALSMRSKGRDAVRDQLMTLSGVGPKVADCVALFSLDQTSAIPVDVHVWRIACRDYDPSLVECKSLTPTVYARVGDLFRDRFGQRAGWAHSLLFAAELPAFKTMLSPEMQLEMDEFRRQEREAKADAKAEKARAKDEKKSHKKSPKATPKAKVMPKAKATRKAKKG
eukprot:jgi/Undpi1/3615/HiC_scaffold_16.g06986.m1